jgi:alpha-ketoglutarate-dependent taurine dioxygenase
MSRYPNVAVRLLVPAERSISSSERASPLVIEAEERRDLKFLTEFLRSHSAELTEDVAKHGAILLRGFDIASDKDFETAVLSIRTMIGMDSVFMEEEGRTAVEGSRYVMHTNSIYTTGGSIDLGSFHTENYFGPDVPQYISFFCQVPSWFGGETGLVNIASVYADLPEALQIRLEQTSFLARTYPVLEVANKYQLTPDEVLRFCADVGLPVAEHNGTQYILLYKPSVLVHPLTGERGLSINYWNNLRRLGFRPAISRAFQADYVSKEWFVHTLLWRYPALQQWVPTMTLVRAPRVSLRNFSEMVVGACSEKFGYPPPPSEPEGPHITSAFMDGDLEIIVAAVRRRFSSFRWRSGDVLIIDNAKMAHAGMPGFGPRLLRALQCNPMQIPYSPTAPGLWAIPDSPVVETIGARIEKMNPSRVRSERCN